MKDWPSDQLEALHACHMIEGMFDEHVQGASFVRDRVNLMDMANNLHEAIADMYQAIGAIESAKEPAP
ncbi:hypothetical protein DB2_51 [Octadecabacter Antarctic DB virus 2]|nr:hypothetical protein DB2_51 [Octadecabacter Antarctic DB virus 2]